MHLYGGYFLGALEGERDKKTQKVAQIVVCHRYEHHTVFIGCQHQGCPQYCLGQGTGATLALENATYRLQRVQFVAF